MCNYLPHLLEGVYFLYFILLYFLRAKQEIDLGGKENCLPSSGSLPKRLQQLRLDHAKTRSLELHPGLPCADGD